jgi:uncharacterized ferritin-like protein (DUF455 family)
MAIKSIREWAERILTGNDLAHKLEVLREAYAEIPRLPLGSRKEIKWEMPQGKEGTKKATPEARMLHSIANIEMMAIYLYWDTISMVEAPYEFYLDMAGIAIQECEHFNLLTHRLNTLGYSFPFLPLNPYLYEFSMKTSHDIRARILYASLYSEGRALDSNERLLMKLKNYNKDLVSYKILEKIIRDEVGHLKNGVKWFCYFSKEIGADPKEECKKWSNELGLIFRPPFNLELRDSAGIPHEWYLDNNSNGR